MIKKIVEKIKENHIQSTTEEAYIKEIAFIQKECWKSNMKQEEIFIETAKYLNRLKLSQDRHPFLIIFRDDVNKLFEENEFNAKEAQRLFNSLYKYRDELLKRS